MLGNIADTNQREAVAALQRALKEGNEEASATAWNQVVDSIAQKVRTDYEMYSSDRNVLSQRGYRMLTTKETEFYNKLIKAGKSSSPMQSFTDLLGTDNGMPETVIEDVYRNLTESHPLLDKITFQDVCRCAGWYV